MKTSDVKPRPLWSLDSDAFAEEVMKAMRRAYLVAKKDAARYGLKLVVNRPTPSRRAKAARSRRVKEFV